MSQRTSLRILLIALATAQTPALAKGKEKAPKEPEKPAKAAEPAPPEDDPIGEDALSEPEDSSAEATATSPPNSAKPGAPEASSAACGVSDRTWSMFLDGGFRWDTGNSSTRDQVGDDVATDNEAVNSLGPMLHLGLLIRQNPYMRMGGALGYGSNYDLNNDGLLIGQLLTVDYRLEFSAPLAGKLFILGAPRAALSLVLPAGALADRIDEYQAAGYDTWSGPRYGFLLGLDAGVRYQASDWLSLRATVGYGWGMHFLLDSKAEGETVSGSHGWQVNASRVSGNLGVEVAF